MTDEKKMPDQPPTREIPQVPAWAVDLTRTMKSGFAKVDIIATDLEEVKDRVGDLEEARKQHSMKVRGTSENDMKQDAAIATIVTRVASIEKKQEEAAVEHSKTKAMLEANTAATELTKATTEEIKKILTTAWNDPRFMALRLALWIALVGWLASKGIKVGQ